MTRAIVDQDITPTARLREGLPDNWEIEVGIENTADAVIKKLQGAQVAFVTSRIPMGREVIENAPDLELIAKLGTGVDSIDLAAAAEHDIPVTHTPGYNALSVAEHTLCLTLAVAHRLTAARNLVEAGEWRDEFELATRLSGSTIGIVGFGDIGKRVGRLLDGFDVEILAADPYVPEIDTELVGAEMTDLDDLLARSDVVSLNTELTAETRGLIGEAELARMADDAILINTARGPVVEEDALVQALREEVIGGAGLDVFATEPLEPESPLLAFEDVVVSPHTSAMTIESRTESIGRLTSNVVTLLSGGDVSERFMARPE
ncbi:NAD(P)-dependent oxidoreductase [Haloarcula sp. 1CSR25-25]|uniref:2-hydroxyacid dehydrogenase n=1 Tax=Haloarcula sp. 1CSR25-25 TaxID=2862545 RepID=UPI002894E89F|nr:NAD(P)-dependent oxidoreductase [Haloarcula sp. 1CSR25-25]MDT3437153.1 D-3-phosphoglycerate dehydrogenase [Haloarcula sp. 1CSR25-25]